MASIAVPNYLLTDLRNETRGDNTVRNYLIEMAMSDFSFFETGNILVQLRESTIRER